MTTGLERAQVLRFPTPADTAPARAGTRRRPRTLRALLTGGRARTRRRLLTGRAGVHRAVPARRARDVHDTAIARGIAPPF